MCHKDPIVSHDCCVGGTGSMSSQVMTHDWGNYMLRGITIYWLTWWMSRQEDNTPDSKVPGANMGPIWVLSAPDGAHVGRRNLAIRDWKYSTLEHTWQSNIWPLSSYSLVSFLYNSHSDDIMTWKYIYITGALCGESTSYPWVALTKSQYCWALNFSLLLAWRRGWRKSWVACNFRHHEA